MMLKATEVLSREEIEGLGQKSDFRAWMEVIDTWAWVAFAFILSGLFPNPVTILISLFMLGGKQLACAIIMHDASHQALFKHRELNDFVGNWLGGYPILHDVVRYRPYHLQHHIHTGTSDDPDIYLTRGYPTSRAGMLRKFGRDLLGITGIKGFVGIMMMHLGILKYTLGGSVEKIPQKGRKAGEVLETIWRNIRGPLVANSVLFGVLWLFGSPWLYLLWVGANLSTYQFCIRVRAMAEHSMVPDRSNPWTHTRTTEANLLEKMLFAPHYVNFHAEHHLLMTVPPYNLPRMHKLLIEKGYYEKGLKAPGYWEIVKMAIPV